MKLDLLWKRQKEKTDKSIDNVLLIVRKRNVLIFQIKLPHIMNAQYLKTFKFDQILNISI